MELTDLIRQRRLHQRKPRSWLSAKLRRAEQCRECDRPWPCESYVAARDSVLVYARRQLDVSRHGR